MIEHPRDPFRDRQPKAQAAVGRVAVSVESAKLFEYLRAFLFRNSGSRVPNFDLQRLPLAAAADEHASTSRISHRIRKKVLQHPPQ